jgi:hypothetical protein
MYKSMHDCGCITCGFIQSKDHTPHTPAWIIKFSLMKVSNLTAWRTVLSNKDINVKVWYLIIMNCVVPTNLTLCFVHPCVLMLLMRWAQTGQSVMTGHKLITGISSSKSRDCSLFPCAYWIQSPGNPPIHRLLNLEVKHSKHEAYYSLPTSTEAKNAWSFTSFLHKS